MNYKGKKYKKVNLRWTHNKISLQKGDLIVVHCKPNTDYFKYNGIHEVVNDSREIHIKNYDDEGHTLCLKIGYNIYYSDVSKLVEVERKKSLPYPVKEKLEY